ncbi:MAG: DUF973 family protein [Nitrososphaerales archaeon]
MVAPAPYPVTAQKPTTNFTATDRVAVGKIKIFAFIGIIGIILGLIVPFSAGGMGYMFAFGTTPTGVGTAVIAAVALGVIGFAVGIYAILKLRSALKDLSTIDKGFSTPATLVLAGLVGFGFLILAFLLLIGGLAVAINGVTSALGLLLGALALFALGGLAAFVGIIGIILGLWKAGERYDNTLVKVGGILYIIPFVDIVAPILVFLGAREIEGKLSSSAGSTSSGP